MVNAEFFVHEVNSKFHYSNRDRVPIKDVIKSLEGYEKIVSQVPHVINSLFSDADISHAELFVSEIESGSLWEDFVIRLFFRDEEGFNEFSKKLADACGSVNLTGNKFVGMIIIALIAYGLEHASSGGAGDRDVSVISNNKLVINNNISATINIDPDVLEKLVIAGIRDKNRLAQGAIEVIKPARSDPEASLSVHDDGEENFRIHPETIRRSPSKYSQLKPDTKVKGYKNIEVSTRASDRDSAKSGWKCIVPEISEKRLSLTIGDGIDIEMLGGESRVTGTIEVTYKYDKERKDYKISSVHLVEVNG